MGNIGGIGILLILALIIGLFFILRELMCWYWKVNERIELQKKTNEILGKILLELIGNSLDSTEKNSTPNTDSEKESS
jgi:hypothetical protein